MCGQSFNPGSSSACITLNFLRALNVETRLGLTLNPWPGKKKASPLKQYVYQREARGREGKRCEVTLCVRRVVCVK